MLPRCARKFASCSARGPRVPTFAGNAKDMSRALRANTLSRGPGPNLVFAD